MEATEQKPLKLIIAVVVYNLSSEIFLLQMAAIKKYCTDKDYSIQIIDNSSDLTKAEDIRYHAGQCEVGYIKTFAGGQGSDSHAWAANFAYTKFREKSQSMFFIDHDCIPVLPFNVEEILSGGHVIAGLGQGAKKKYFWPGLVMFVNDRIEPAELVDFSTNGEFGLDTGGNLYKVIEKYGEDSCIFFNEAYHQNPYFNVLGGNNHYAMLADNRFMHFVASSGWNNHSHQEERTNTLLNIAREKTGL